MNSNRTENININFNTVSTPNPNNNPPSDNSSTNKDININTSLLLYIFNKSNVILLIWFLAIYLLLYLVLGIFFKTDNMNDTLLLVSRIFDLVILMITVILILSTYYTLSEPEKENIIYSTGKSFKHTIDDPTTIYSLVLFITAFYMLIYSIGIPMSYSAKPISVTIIESTAWILLTIIVISNIYSI